MQTTVAAIGDNNPPDEFELLRAQIAERQAAILSGTAKLLDSATRAPKIITSADEAEKTTALIKLLTTNQKSLEGAFKLEKAPFLNGGRVVENFFNFHTDKVEATKKALNTVMTAWLQKLAAEERQRREDEAKLQREQAARELAAATQLEQSGMTAFAESAVAQAEITEQNANKLATSAQAKPAHLASSRSVGATTSLRTRWVGEVIDRGALDLEALRQHLPADALQKALKSFIVAGGRELKGAKIFEESEAVTR